MSSKVRLPVAILGTQKYVAWYSPSFQEEFIVKIYLVYLKKKKFFWEKIPFYCMIKPLCLVSRKSTEDHSCSIKWRVLQILNMLTMLDCGVECVDCGRFPDLGCAAEN